MASRTTKKKKKSRFKLDNKQKRILLIVLLVLVLLFFMYGRSIIKLKIENNKLQKQQEELQAEKNQKTKEYNNIHSEDYIKDQARKKLRLLEEDEKIFFFKGESDEE